MSTAQRGSLAAFPRRRTIDERHHLVRAEGDGDGVRVGVIDSGWDRTIADPRVTPGIGLTDEQGLELRPSADDHDRIGHGTSVTDLLLRIAPAVTIVPIRIFGRRLETSPGVLVAALYWAVEQRLAIVNLSLGTVREDIMVPLYRACEHARQRGTILVAAAANADQEWSYPAVFDSVIGVGHGDYDDATAIAYCDDDALECRANFSQRARGLAGRLEEVHGASMAVPIVTGYVARVLQHHPRADVHEVRRIFTGG